jgi:hypothetical protein
LGSSLPRWGWCGVKWSEDRGRKRENKGDSCKQKGT